MIKSIISIFAVLVLVTSCNSKPVNIVERSQYCIDNGVNLTGAGATFPAPLYARWFYEYDKTCGVKVNYQAIGSGGGISQYTAKTVDFGASDGIMTNAQFDAVSGTVMVPMTAGSVAVVYNTDQLGLKLTSDILADIYLGKITDWSDPRISAINESSTTGPITVVHRADGSGTTNIFTNYLSKVSNDWSNSVGSGNSVNWPVGLGGEQNAGVAGQVNQMPGAIGYVELAYAIQTNMKQASLQNYSGKFVEPTIESTTAAMVGVELPDDMLVMLTNSDNANAYPIVGLTWILANSNHNDKNGTIVSLLNWALHDGQSYSTALNYAPLSEDAVIKALAIVSKIQ